MGHKFCRCIEPRVIDPLIINTQRPLRFEVCGQAVFCENCQSIGGNQLRYTVVDLRINMVRSAGKHNSASALFRHFLQASFTFSLYIALCFTLFRPCCVYSCPYLMSRDVPFLRTGLDEAVCRCFFVGQGNKRPDDMLVPFGDFLYIVLKVLRIRHHNGTVKMILCTARLLMFIENTGIENGFDTLIDQPLDVTVGQLGRITLRF